MKQNFSLKAISLIKYFDIYLIVVNWRQGRGEWIMLQGADSGGLQMEASVPG